MTISPFKKRLKHGKNKPKIARPRSRGLWSCSVRTFERPRRSLGAGTRCEVDGSWSTAAPVTWPPWRAYPWVGELAEPWNETKECREKNNRNISKATLYHHQTIYKLTFNIRVKGDFKGGRASCHWRTALLLGFWRLEKVEGPNVLWGRYCLGISDCPSSHRTRHMRLLDPELSVVWAAQKFVVA